MRACADPSNVGDAEVDYHKEKSSAVKSNKQLHKREMIGATKRAAASAKKKITLVDIVPKRPPMWILSWGNGLWL